MTTQTVSNVFMRNTSTTHKRGDGTMTTAKITSETMTREQFDAVFVIDGKPAMPQNELDRQWGVLQSALADDAILEANGVKLTFRNHLLRVSNVTSHNGRMLDATCHREYQITIAGKTFGIKDSLKELGYRWDNVEKLWYRPMTTKGTSIHDHTVVAKAELIELLSK